MLTLPIKKKWFDMILSGEKKEEYREIKSYYKSRFLNLWGCSNSDIPKNIMFRNGYSKDSPYFIAKCTISYNYGNPKWGAESNKLYYVLKILEIIEVGNIGRKKCQEK